jgi:hypothetical protein
MRYQHKPECDCLPISPTKMPGLPFTIHLHPTRDSPFQWMPPRLEEKYLEQARLQGQHQ